MGAAKGAVYTIGGGPTENTLCTTLDDSVVETESGIRFASLTPDASEKVGNTDYKETHNTPNTGTGTASVTDFVCKDEVSKSSVDNNEFVHASG